MKALILNSASALRDMAHAVEDAPWQSDWAQVATMSFIEEAESFWSAVGAFLADGRPASSRSRLAPGAAARPA